MLQQLVGSQQGKYGPAAAVVKFVGLPLAVHELVQVLALGVAVEVEPADQLVLSVDVQVELAAAEAFVAREASDVLEKARALSEKVTKAIQNYKDAESNCADATDKNTKESVNLRLVHSLLDAVFRHLKISLII